MKKTNPNLNILHSQQLDINPEDVKKTIVYFGTPEFSAYILEKLLDESTKESSSLHFGSVTSNLPKFIIQSVVTSPDKPVGRKQIVIPSATALVAQENNIPTLKPEKITEEFIKQNLPLLEADLYIVASFGKILPQQLLEIPQFGAINVHPSLLPKYRGPAPYVQPILDGQELTGVTIMLMDAKMDHGDILSQTNVDIQPSDTAETLGQKLSHEGAKLLIKTIPSFISGKITSKPQNHGLATITKLIKKTDGYFEIDNPPSPEILNRLIRAYHPWPGVWTRWNEKIVKFLPNLSNHSSNLTIQQFNNSILIQIEGKKPIDLKSFLNGYPDFPIKKI